MSRRMAFFYLPPTGWLTSFYNPPKNKDNKTYKKVVEAYQTEATKKAIEKTYHGSEVAAWPIFGKN